MADNPRITMHRTPNLSDEERRRRLKLAFDVILSNPKTKKATQQDDQNKDHPNEM
jgi:hypothetical protein